MTSSMLFMTIGNGADPELAVDGGTLELEEEDESLSSPLLLRGGGSEEQQTSSLLMPETIIEQTIQPDGSIAIKASTISPHPNGFRDVKIEHYTIPSDKAAEVDTAEGSPPPSADYLTRVEYRVLSPGLELEPPDDDDASTVYTVPVANNHGGDNSSVATYTRSNRKRRRKRSYGGILLISGVVIFLAIIIGVAVTRDYSHYHQTSESSHDSTHDSDEQPDTTPENDFSPKEDANTAPQENDGHHHHHHHHTHGNRNMTLPDKDGPEYNTTSIF